MKYKIFLAIFILCLISSLILTSNSALGLCKPGQGCSTVNNSVYGSTLGIKNSIYGVFIFLFMIFLTLFHMERPNKHTRRMIHISIIIGSIIAIYFLYLQFFVIKAVCEFCLAVDLGLLIALIFMVSLWDN